MKISRSIFKLIFFTKANNNFKSFIKFSIFLLLILQFIFLAFLIRIIIHEVPKKPKWIKIYNFNETQYTTAQKQSRHSTNRYYKKYQNIIFQYWYFCELFYKHLYVPNTSVNPKIMSLRNRNFGYVTIPHCKLVPKNQCCKD